MKTAKACVVAATALLAALALAAAACGKSDGGSATTGGEQSGVVLTVEQALAAEPGQELNVQGAVFFTAKEVVLASAVMESYPPQPGGATLTVEGLEPEALVGLSSTAGEPGLVQVTWSDYPVVLRGVVEDGVLEVTGTPRISERTTAGVTVRFSPVSEPVRSEEPVWWAFDVASTGDRPVVLTFSSGQRGEVVLSRAGAEEYRWSSGKAFTEAIETVTVEPGETFAVVLNDTMTAGPGDYELTAKVTASAGAGGQVAPLPSLTMTLTVR
jgi:hypothetical protein